MTKRFMKLFGALAAVAALAVGGSAIASAQQKAPASPAAEQVGGPDTDSIQSGDQTTPDAAGVSATAAEAPGTEAPSASETPGAPEAAETPGSESAPNSDGPGGHADEPGNPTADHQFQGNE
jgi:hypothetical protein